MAPGRTNWGEFMLQREKGGVEDRVGTMQRATNDLS